MSAREEAVVALFVHLSDALATRNPPPVVLRNETVPQRLPAGGLVVVRDGETVEETPIMSPLAWAVQQRAEVEVVAPGETAASRAALLDDLLRAIGDAIATDRTLSAAVEWSQPESPSFDDIDFEGATAARSALVPVSLFFTVADTPLA
jgi:FtsP/CotA-like multicopper oxidase with cupredoxin domain